MILCRSARWVVLLLVALRCAAADSRDSIDAAGFWDSYFRDRIATMRHDRGAWTGVALSGTQPSLPRALLEPAPSVEFSISDDALRHYDYGADDRFRMNVYSSVAEAFAAIEDRTYRYRDAAPFGKERMAELLGEVRKRARWTAGSEITRTRLERLAAELMNAPADKPPTQHLAAIAWLLGEMRDRASSAVLVDILRRSAYVRPAAGVSSVAVDAAFSALWKINDKATLEELLALMRQANPSGRRRFAALFQRLLSENELLSIGRLGPEWSEPRYWAGQIRAAHAHGLVDWDRRDAVSLYWELRWHAARRLPAGDPVLTGLAGDVVETVRHAARGRESIGKQRP